jgi:5-methylcytosine-specific restriction endonuclease McrA
MGDRVQYEIVIFEWAKKYLDKGICPACMKNPIRKGLRSCSPKCNERVYKYCVVIHDWNVLRYECFERDRHQCVMCPSSDNLQADHIKPVRLNPELEWVLDNLQTLCKECHKLKTKQDIQDITNHKYKVLGMEEHIKK